MTTLLVSVRTPAEAIAALQGGADWLDLKEPAHGPLGAVDAAVAEEIANVVDGRMPISAAAGELADWQQSSAQQLLHSNQARLIKLGLSHCSNNGWERAWHRAERQIAAAGKQLVPVIYADRRHAHSPSPSDIIQVSAGSLCPWILVDTFDKSRASLLDELDSQELTGLLTSIRAAGKQTVVAGRLTFGAIALLPLQHIDMIGVRSAVCGGDRNGAVCQESVEKLSAMLRAA